MGDPQGLTGVKNKGIAAQFMAGKLHALSLQENSAANFI